MLRLTQVSALDLLLPYDKSDDGTLAKREFLAMMKAKVGDETAWRGGAKDAALDVFVIIAGADKVIDVEELVRWLPHTAMTAEEASRPPVIIKPMARRQSSMARVAGTNLRGVSNLMLTARRIMSVGASKKSSRTAPMDKYQPASDQ